MTRRILARIMLGLLLGLLLGTILTVSFIWPSRVVAADFSSEETVNTSVEYSNGTIASSINGLDIWYVWINTSYTQVIYMAFVSNVYPPPVLTFFGQHYMTADGTEVFVGNTLTALEVYNDTNKNGLPDVNPVNGTSELLYNFAVNSSRSFTVTPVEKTLLGDEYHYTWGLRYNTIDGSLLTENQAEGARIMLDYLATSYDFYVRDNASFLKTSFEIGTISNVTSTSGLNVNLTGLSLSLLYGTSIISSKAYTTVINGNPYNSTTATNSTEPTDLGEITVGDTEAYKCVFGQNYTLIMGSGNETYPSRSAAVSDQSVPGGVYRSVEGTLPFFEDVLSSLFPKMSNLTATVNLDYNVSSFLYRVCYPQWDGYAIEHDPTYIAYLATTTVPEMNPSTLLIITVTATGSTVLMMALIGAGKKRKYRLIHQVQE
jgi:hypothetical protein